MIAYVESNFVLEVALQREDAAAAERLIALAEEGTIEIALPAIALYEPYGTLTTVARERRRLSSSLETQLRELQRAAPHQDVVGDLEGVPATLVDLARREMDLLETTIGRLLVAGRILDLDEAAFERSQACQAQHGLSPQDAIVYAGVLEDLANRDEIEEKFFASKNTKDFDIPGVHEELEAHGCIYCPTFSSVLEQLEV